MLKGFLELVIRLKAATEDDMISAAKLTRKTVVVDLDNPVKLAEPSNPISITPALTDSPADLVRKALWILTITSDMLCESCPAESPDELTPDLFEKEITS